MAGESGDNRVLVLGGGRFGRLAVHRLGARVTLLVEPNPGPELQAMGVPICVGDGIAAAGDILDRPDAPHWVVPALPLHFLVEWLCLSLAHLSPRLLEIPRQALPQVAMLHAGAKNAWYLSLANFRCPDDCPEPALICTHTNEPRGEPMFKRMAKIKLPGFRTVIMRSRQLAPGVGALPREELLGLREQIRQSGQGSRWVIGTACRCHGVVQAVQFGEDAI